MFGLVATDQQFQFVWFYANIVCLAYFVQLLARFRYVTKIYAKVLCLDCFQIFISTRKITCALQRVKK
jgi:hypothetical protein